MTAAFKAAALEPEAAGPLILAIPRGRILAESASLLARAGIRPAPGFDDEASRALRFPTDDPSLEVVRVRSFDVATFVAFGAAHLGICGADVLMEFDYPEIYAPLDLGIGACRVSVAEPRETAGADDARTWSRVRVATKYPNIARRHYATRGINADVVQLSGAMELAPGLGLKLGDTLTLNVLGREIEGKIVNFRHVDFSNGNQNFILILSPGLIDKAPHSFLATVRVDPSDEEPMYRAVTDKFPGVSTVRVKDAIAQVNGLLQQLSDGVRAASLVTILAGLLPVLWSHGTGADVMKRIAAPMVGGVVTSALLELVVYPALYLTWKGRRLAD